MQRLNQAGLILCIALAGLTCPVAAEDAEPTISIAGIRIVRPAHKEDDQMRAFNWFSGTTVVLLVQRPGGGLIDFNAEASSLSAFTDNKGTNLLAADDKWSRNGLSSANISDDGQAAMIEVQAAGLPAQGATHLMFKGVATFDVATKTKLHKSEKVPLKVDQKIAVGPLNFTIKKVGAPEWGDAALSVQLEAQQDLKAIKALRFIGPDGKPIKADRSGSMSYRWGDKLTVQQDFNLETKIEEATIEIDVWEDMQQIKVPFEINSSVGLGTK